MTNFVVVLQMVQWWLYNNSRGANSGSGNGGNGQLRISTEPIRVLSAQNWYWTKHKDTKIPIEIFARWKEAKGIEDNTDWLGVDVGLTEVQWATKKAKQAMENEEFKSIPWKFRNEVVKQMYDSEPQEVKDEIDKERFAVSVPLESEVDLLIRKERLVKANR